MNALDEKAYQARLPKKRMAAGCLFWNEAGDILLVKPVYRPHWLLPGGVVEAHESPWAACAREVREELGLARPPQRLLCVDYVAADDGRTESLQFIFAGGGMAPAELAQIVLPADELSAFGCWAPATALKMVSSRTRPRLQQALAVLQGDTAVYLENGSRPQRGLNPF